VFELLGGWHRLGTRCRSKQGLKDGSGRADLKGRRRVEGLRGVKAAGLRGDGLGLGLPGGEQSLLLSAVWRAVKLTPAKG